MTADGIMEIRLTDVVGLFLLAIPVACIARTVVYEELLREPREFCRTRCERSRSFVERKFFYLFTCEYCFSHYVTAAALSVTRYRIMYEGWRGYAVAFFSLVFIANVYLAIYARLRIDVNLQRKRVEAVDAVIGSNGKVQTPASLSNETAGKT